MVNNLKDLLPVTGAFFYFTAVFVINYCFSTALKDNFFMILTEKEILVIII